MKKRDGWKRVARLLGIWSWSLLVSLVRADVPPMIPIQGFLTDSSGQPVDGPIDLTVSLYAATDGGEPLFQETQLDALVERGAFAVYLGQRSPLDPGLFAVHDAVYVAIRVGEEEEEMSPRLPLASVPYAAFSQHCHDATMLAGLPAGSVVTSKTTIPWSKLTEVPAGISDGDSDTLGSLRCSTADQVAKWNGSDWQCGVDHRGTAGGPVSADEFSLNAARDEFITLPGLAFKDQTKSQYLVEHTVTGRLFLSTLAPASLVAYTTSPLQLPNGANLREAGCLLERQTTAEVASIGLRRTRRNGSAASFGSAGFFAGSGPTGIQWLTFDINASPVSHPTSGSYYMEVTLTNTNEGSDTELRLLECFVRYSRQVL